MGTLRAWGQLDHSRSRGSLLDGTATQSAAQASLSHQFRRFSVEGRAGYSMFEQEGVSSPEQGYVTLQGDWRPTGYLTVIASHSLNRSFPEFGPSPDNLSTSLSVTINAGLLSLHAGVFEAREVLVLTSSSEVSTRSNRQYTLSISRRLGGLLPIVSAPKRNGTVR